MRLVIALLLALCAAANAAPPNGRNIPAGFPWYVVPHVVDGTLSGGTWTTSIIIANLGSTPAAYRINFYGNGGNAQAFPIVGRGSGVTFTGNVPVNGSTILTTAGSTSSPLVQGWAQLDDNNSSADLGIMAIFRQRVAGRADYEASVPASTPLDYYSLIPFDNMLDKGQQYVSGFAILNPQAAADSLIPIDFYDEAGARLGGETLLLGPRKKIVFVATDRWPVLAGKRGTIQFAGGAYGLSMLGFRFGPEAFTTLTLMDR